jgi:hypothetical protein
MKFCKDCEHVRPFDRWTINDEGERIKLFIHRYCGHPSAEFDPVDGLPLTPASAERASKDDRACGITAKHFERKESRLSNAGEILYRIMKEPFLFFIGLLVIAASSGLIASVFFRMISGEP